MVATKRQPIPARLREKVAPGPFALSVDHPMIYLLFGLGLAAMIGFGPAYGYGWVYVFGPPVSLLVSALLFTIFPFKPYRGAPITRHTPVDVSDPAARRLVELFRSAESRVVLWRAAAKLTGWLLLISLAIAVLRHRSLGWGVPSGNQVLDVVGSALGSYIALGTEYVGSGLRTWAEREMSEHGGE